MENNKMRKVNHEGDLGVDNGLIIGGGFQSTAHQQTVSSGLSSSFPNVNLSNQNTVQTFEEIDDPHFSAFEEWSKKNGASFSKVRFVKFDKEGRGGLATTDFHEDEEMCSVPLSMLISIHVIKSSEIGKIVVPILEELGVSEDWPLWYIFLLSEKGRCQTSWLPNPILPPSFWSPYFQILPEQIVTPLSFDDEQLHELKGTNLMDATLKIKSRLQSTYELIFPTLFERFPSIFDSRLYSFEHYEWAYQVFWSRALSVILDNVQQAAMIPLADMLNHSSRVKVSYFTEINSGRFLLKTFSPIKSGDQVYNNFGPRSNEKLLLNYGFVIEDNFADSYFIKIGYSAGDPLAAQKQNLLAKRGLTFEHYLTRGNIPIDSQLIDSMRICLMNDVELYFYEDGSSASQSEQQRPGSIFISIRNENLMLNTLRKLLLHKLQNFETTIEEDQKILLTMSHTMSYQKRVAVICRLGQKQIIQNALYHYLPQLQRDFNRRLFNNPRISQFRTASHYTAPHERRDAHIIAFEKWIRANCIVNRNVTWVDFGNKGKGLISTGYVEEGNDLFVIPYKLLVTAQNILSDSELGRRLNSIEGLSLDDDFVILMFLMEERFALKSKWAPFFRALPIFTSPLLFNDEELEELEGTYLFDEVATLKDEYEQEFQMLIDALIQMELFDDKIHTFPNFLWSKVLFESRVVEVSNVSTSVVSPAIPPLALPPNLHPFACITKVFSKESSSLHVTTQTPYPIHSQVFDGTGGSANHQLFLDHGVVIEDNPDDTLSIELNLGNNELTPSKEEILRRFGISMEHYLRIGPLSPKLLMAVRVCVMNSEELSSFMEDGKSLHHISKRNEMQMIETLTNLLNGILMGYSTSIEEDQELLSSAELSPNRRLAILYRKGQKEIVRAAQESVERHRGG